LLQGSQRQSVIVELVVFVLGGKVHNVGVVHWAAFQVLHLPHHLNLIPGVVLYKVAVSLKKAA
jgi:hypothetical protein